MRRKQRDCSNRLAQRRYSHHHMNFLRMLIDLDASADGITSEKLSTTYKSVVPYTHRQLQSILVSTTGNHCFRIEPCVPSGRGYAPLKLRAYRSMFRPGTYFCSFQQLLLPEMLMPADTIKGAACEDGSGSHWETFAFFERGTLSNHASARRQPTDRGFRPYAQLQSPLV
jgi:hypothetical protein